MLVKRNHSIKPISQGFGWWWNQNQQGLQKNQVSQETLSNTHVMFRTTKFRSFRQRSFLQSETLFGPLGAMKWEIPHLFRCQYMHSWSQAFLSLILPRRMVLSCMGKISYHIGSNILRRNVSKCWFLFFGHFLKGFRLPLFWRTPI